MVAQVLDKLGEDGLKPAQGHGRIFLLLFFCVFGGCNWKTRFDELQESAPAEKGKVYSRSEIGFGALWQMN